MPSVLQIRIAEHTSLFVTLSLPTIISFRYLHIFLLFLYTWLINDFIGDFEHAVSGLYSILGLAVTDRETNKVLQTGILVLAGLGFLKIQPR